MMVASGANYSDQTTGWSPQMVVVRLPPKCHCNSGIFQGVLQLAWMNVFYALQPREVLDKRALALVFPARLRPPSRPWSEIPGDQQTMKKSCRSHVEVANLKLHEIEMP